MEVERAAVLGNSLGGLMVLHLALSEPERVSALVLSDSAALGQAVNPAQAVLSSPGGAELVFVPSYSPDLNPIEQAFSKIKNILRKLGARTHEALLEAMEEALSKVTPADAVGWFNHCGYQVEVQYL